MDMTSSGAPVLDRLMTIGRRSREARGSSVELGSLAMDATATPRGISVYVITPLAKGISLRPSIVFVDSVLVTPAPHTATRPI